MNEHQDDLPSDVKRLLEIDRDFSEIPTRARTRVARRLAIPIIESVRPPASVGAGANATWKALAAKGLAGIVVVASALAGARYALKSNAPAPPTLVATSERVATPFGVVTEPQTTTATATPRIEETVAAPPVVVRSQPQPKSDVAVVEAEHRVLDQARAAVAAGEPEKALVATAEHAARFPHGTLAEERDAIEIRALAALGRKSEARAALADLRTRFPRSFLLEGATEEVESIPCPPRAFAPKEEA